MITITDDKDSRQTLNNCTQQSTLVVHGANSLYALLRMTIKPEC